MKYFFVYVFPRAIIFLNVICSTFFLVHNVWSIHIKSSIVLFIFCVVMVYLKASVFVAMAKNETATKYNSRIN